MAGRTWVAAHARIAQGMLEAVTLSLDARLSWTLGYSLPALASVAQRVGDPASRDLCLRGRPGRSGRSIGQPLS